MQRTHYSQAQLTRYYLQDLIVDLRCIKEYGKTGPEWEAYAAKLRSDIARIFRGRHAARTNRYGIPQV